MALFFKSSGNGSAVLAPPKTNGSVSAPTVRRARRTGRKRIVMGLDIGTTKVCAIIADVDAEGGVTVLGLGSSPSRGMRRGMVTDINHTVSAIEKAYLHAYELARATPSEIYVGIAGDHISGINAEAIVEVAHPNVGIDERDCRNVIKRALQISMPPDVEILYNVVREFIVNGNGGIQNPKGLFGSKLEVKMHVVTGSVTAGSNIARCVKKAGLRTSGVVLEAIASSQAILTQRERELGVVMIDIGGGTCDLAIFSEGTLHYTAEIAHGGDVITHDIAQVMRCSPHEAENLKKKFGHANPLTIDVDEHVDLPNPLNGGRRISYKRRELAEIIEARVEDIFFDVKKVIQRSGYKDRIYAGVVLTGGTALLEGIGEVAERILDFPTRTGMPQGLRGLSEVVSSPIYSTGVGLIKWAIEEGPGYKKESWLIRKIKEVFDIYA
ncbi:cell division protein FtsA [Candidatus Sumerlaeota bacterium]|nr:cell division protein FtsA [Candidatus Sumerlaeota bacterium]